MQSARLFLLLCVVSPGLACAALLHLSSVSYLSVRWALPRALPASTAASIVSIASRTAGPASLMMYRGYVAQATVLVLGKSCTGFVADEPDTIVTAAHCIPHGTKRVSVETADDKRYTASVDRIDRNADLAVLRLPRPLEIPPLPLATKLPERREPLLFAGRSDRPGSAQVGAVERIGRCPSLPHVSRAIFTSIDARPGDSGAPVLDSELRVVGIVHGGARCHILAPVQGLARQLEDEPPDPRTRA